jgi:hypothetical protein
MSSGPPDYLRLLGTGASSVGAASKIRGVGPRADPAAAPGVEHADFADLLARVQSGDLSSGINVSVDDDAGVSLNETDLAMLTLAADKAEAAGIRRALVLVAGQAVIMDVHTRTVVGKADMEGGVLSGIDGVIRLGDEGDASGSGKTLPVPSGFIAANPALAAALSARDARVQKIDRP